MSIIADTSLNLPTPQAQLFACPIPEEYHVQGEIIQRAVEQAVRESVEQGVDKKGKEVTPWLLKRVGELTEGKALKSSKSLYGMLTTLCEVAHAAVAMVQTSP